MARAEILTIDQHLEAAHRDLERAAATELHQMAPAPHHMYRANLIASANAHALLAQAAILAEVLRRVAESP